MTLTPVFKPQTDRGIRAREGAFCRLYTPPRQRLGPSQALSAGEAVCTLMGTPEVQPASSHLMFEEDSGSLMNPDC